MVENIKLLTLKSNVESENEGELLVIVILRTTKFDLCILPVTKVTWRQLECEDGGPLP